MRRRERGLSALLAGSFLLFALTLAAGAAGVYWLWNAWIDRIYTVTDWDALVSSPELAQGGYDALRARLAGGDAFAVVTEEGAPASLTKIAEVDRAATPSIFCCC